MKEAFKVVEGIGPEMAHSIVMFFQSKEGKKTVGRLKNEVNTKQPKRGSARRPLEGKTLVVTGTLEKFTRKEIQDLIKNLGGKAAGSVSKKTDYVVAGKEAGSKLAKAHKLGIKVLDEAGFLELVGME